MYSKTFADQTYKQHHSLHTNAYKNSEPPSSLPRLPNVPVTSATKNKRVTNTKSYTTDKRDYPGKKSEEFAHIKGDDQHSEVTRQQSSKAITNYQKLLSHHG